MKLLCSLVLIVVIIVTSGTHMYFIWKMRDYKTLKIQIAVIGLAIIAGILVIYEVEDPSISYLLNRLSPL